MSKFTPRCPKCSGINVNFETTNLGYTAQGKDPWLSRYMSCFTCGKQVHGTDLKEMLEEQHATWKQKADLRKVAMPNRIADAQREAAERVKQREVNLTAQKMREELELAAKKVVESPPDKTPITITVASPFVMCDWRECQNPARKTSKYCSRACSNKNARWRYKKRHAKKAA